MVSRSLSLLRPVKIFVELARLKKVLKFFQSCIGAKIKHFSRHGDPAEQVEKFRGAGSGGLQTLETGEQRMDLVETDPIASIVSITVSYAQLTTRERVRHNLCDVPNLVVF
jgi:hypothetical protein